MAENGYILMKRSRSPANDTARASDAYMGGSCEDAGIEPEKVYNDFKEAAADALALLRVNKVGWRVWRVGDTFPTATTERGDTYTQRPVPLIEDSEFERWLDENAPHWRDDSGSRQLDVLAWIRSLRSEKGQGG